ncbi:MAG TPA: glycerophosphodiester phosphodiesterase family protein [Vicinamibacterales bacterium]
MSIRFLPGAAALALLVVSQMPSRIHAADGSAPKTPWLIAHRGASAYAPENTVPAFQLAAEQGATFVETDIQFTKDKVIVCLHDLTLERTTDVEEVYPDRAREVESGGKKVRRWFLEDFTLAELRKLDAGSWFDPKFKGTRIPTFAEYIESLRGRSGLYVELKSPEKYPGIEKAMLEELQRFGLDKPWADPRTPVLLQSFTASSLELLAKDLGTKLPIHFLFGARDAGKWLTPEGLAKVKTFSTGISPEKTAVLKDREAVARAKGLGLLVTPYTFRAAAVEGFPDVGAEMAHYLNELGVDGVITDNPDRMPSAASARR